MLHQASIIYLFRPFIRINLAELPAKPRDICLDAANSICDTFVLYQQRHPLLFTVSMMAQLLLFASTIFLLDLSSPSSEAALIRCVLGMRELRTWKISEDAFEVIRSLARRWNIILPPSVTAILSTYDITQPTDAMLRDEIYQAEPIMEDDSRVASWLDEARIGFGDWGGWHPEFGEITADVRRYSYESGVFC